MMEYSIYLMKQMIHDRDTASFHIQNFVESKMKSTIQNYSPDHRMRIIHSAVVLIKGSGSCTAKEGSRKCQNCPVHMTRLDEVYSCVTSGTSSYNVIVSQAFLQMCPGINLEDLFMELI